VIHRRIASRVSCVSGGGVSGICEPQNADGGRIDRPIERHRHRRRRRTTAFNAGAVATT
jgi:hypothetical protein